MAAPLRGAFRELCTEVDPNDGALLKPEVVLFRGSLQSSDCCVICMGRHTADLCHVGVPYPALALACA